MKQLRSHMAHLADQGPFSIQPVTPEPLTKKFRNFWSGF